MRASVEGGQSLGWGGKRTSDRGKRSGGVFAGRSDFARNAEFSTVAFAGKESPELFMTIKL